MLTEFSPLFWLLEGLTHLSIYLSIPLSIYLILDNVPELGSESGVEILVSDCCVNMNRNHLLHHLLLDIVDGVLVLNGSVHHLLPDIVDGVLLLYGSVYYLLLDIVDGVLVLYCSVQHLLLDVCNGVLVLYCSVQYLLLDKGGRW